MQKLVGIALVVATLAVGRVEAQVGSSPDPFDPSEPPVVVPVVPAVLPWPDAFMADYGRLYPSFQRAVQGVAEDEALASLLDALLGLVQSQAGIRRADTVPVEGTCSYLGGTGGSLVGDGGSGTLFADGGAGSLVPDGGTGSLFGDGGAVLQPFMAAFFDQGDKDHAWSLVFAPSPSRPDGDLARVTLHDDIAIIDRFELDAFDEGSRGPGELQRPTALDVAWQLALTPRAVPVDRTDLIVVPHGHLVLHHVLQAFIGHVGAVRGVDVVRRSAPDRVEITLAWSSGRTARVSLYPMDFRSLDGLGEALEHLAVPDRSRTRIVMSWTLSNCALLERYRDREVSELDSPLAATSYAEFVYGLLIAGLEEAGQPLLTTLCDALSQREDALVDVACDDVFALATLLADLERRASEDAGDGAMALTAGSLWLRGFAAAGNHRLPFPLPPASWPGVYGVAACSPTQTAHAWFSNRGDVIADEHLIAPGAWYFEHPQGAGSTDLGYWGTSFAAPYAALRFGALLGEAAGGPHALGTCNVSIAQGRYRR